MSLRQRTGILLRRHLGGIAEFVGQDSAASRWRRAPRRFRSRAREWRSRRSRGNCTWPTCSEGSVRKSGDQLRITAQLIRAAEGYHLWSETYDRKMDDIFKIQDEIAGEVVKELKVKLLGAAPKVRTTDPKAYALYLQARELGRQLNRRGVREVRRALPAGARNRSALRPGVGRAGQELHQQDAAWACCPTRRGMPVPAKRRRRRWRSIRITHRRTPGSAPSRCSRQRSRRRGATLPAGLGARSDRSRACSRNAATFLQASAGWTRRWRSTRLSSAAIR